jgi:hypothetical protein
MNHQKSEEVHDFVLPHHGKAANSSFTFKMYFSSNPRPPLPFFLNTLQLRGENNFVLWAPVKPA